MSDCTTSASCSKQFGRAIQTNERSAMDSTTWASNKALYGNIQDQYISNGIAPKFKSSADYIRYKKMTAELYSTARTIPNCPHKL